MKDRWGSFISLKPVHNLATSSSASVCLVRQWSSRLGQGCVARQCLLWLIRPILNLHTLSHVVQANDSPGYGGCVCPTVFCLLWHLPTGLSFSPHCVLHLSWWHVPTRGSGCLFSNSNTGVKGTGFQVAFADVLKLVAKNWSCPVASGQLTIQYIIGISAILDAILGQVYGNSEMPIHQSSPLGIVSVIQKNASMTFSFLRIELYKEWIVSRGFRAFILHDCWFSSRP